MRVTRKRFRVLLLAAIVAAIAVPVGFALSLEPAPPAPRYTAAVAPAAIVLTGVPMEGNASSGWLGSLPDVPDPVKLVIVGTSLFGLAAVVRKAT